MVFAKSGFRNKPNSKIKIGNARKREKNSAEKQNSGIKKRDSPPAAQIVFIRY